MHPVWAPNRATPALAETAQKETPDLTTKTAIIVETPTLRTTVRMILYTST